MPFHNRNFLSTPLIILSTHDRTSTIPTSHMANYKAGDLILIKYGNGTQAARVRRVLHTGGIKIDRFIPRADYTTGSWRQTGITLNPIQVISRLPEDDRRIAAIAKS